MDLLEAFDQWVLVSSPAPRTSVEYGYCMRRLVSHGIRKVEDATPETISAYVAGRLRSYKAEGKSGLEMVRKDVANLCTVLGYLVVLRLAKRSQLRAVRRCRPKARKARFFLAPHLKRPEYERLVEGGRERDSVIRRYRPRDTAFMVQAGTLSGLRGGELARLRWERVNFQSRVIEVRIDRALGDLGGIKNKIERDVPICAELLQVLRDRREQFGDDRGFLFGHGVRARKNAHATVKTLWRELCWARQYAELPDVDFHLLRHTRASWWLQGDGTGTGPRATLEEVSLWLGDDPQVVARYYAGLTRGYSAACEAGPRPIRMQRKESA